MPLKMWRIGRFGKYAKFVQQCEEDIPYCAFYLKFKFNFSTGSNKYVLLLIVLI